MTIKEALLGKEIPKEIKDNLVLFDVSYLSFDGVTRHGQLVVHKNVAMELKEIFNDLLRIKFPIDKVTPISAYNWSDEDSMSDNNTSVFNYRFIYGTNRLSNHSYGLAIDINPALNPYVASDGKIFPTGAVYNPERPGALKRGSEAVFIFTSRGWEWGGEWEHKDWQHFQKIKKLI